MIKRILALSLLAIVVNLMSVLLVSAAVGQTECANQGKYYVKLEKELGYACKTSPANETECKSVGGTPTTANGKFSSCLNMNSDHGNNEANCKATNGTWYSGNNVDGGGRGCTFAGGGSSPDYTSTPLAIEEGACAGDSMLFGFIPTWYSGLKCDTTGKPMIPNDDPDAMPNFIWTIVLNCIDILLRLAGVIAVVMILYNAYQYITNNGNEQRVAAAKMSLLQIAFGLVIIVVSSTLIRFIISRLSQP
jgi:hypothetical protein